MLRSFAVEIDWAERWGDTQPFPQELAAEPFHPFHLGHGEVVKQEGPLQSRYNTVLKTPYLKLTKQMAVVNRLKPRRSHPGHLNVEDLS